MFFNLNIRYLDSLKNIQYKIVIAGNHEVTFDPATCQLKDGLAKKELKNCIYLEDDSIELLGLKIYGSPW